LFRFKFFNREKSRCLSSFISCITLIISVLLKSHVGKSTAANKLLPFASSPDPRLTFAEHVCKRMLQARTVCDMVTVDMNNHLLSCRLVHVYASWIAWSIIGPIPPLTWTGEWVMWSSTPCLWCCFRGASAPAGILAHEWGIKTMNIKQVRSWLLQRSKKRKPWRRRCLQRFIGTYWYPLPHRTDEIFGIQESHAFI
jgi:hypothetical protein